MGPLDREFKRILVVEDHDFTRDMIVQQLTQLGFRQVDQAAGGSEALTKLDPFPPDLVICDINMKPMTGFEFVKTMKDRVGREWTVPVIFLTAHANPELVKKARDLGVTNYLVKPTDKATLSQRIDRALAGN
jgi:two-component system chemotaxis response regulator CheY